MLFYAVGEQLQDSAVDKARDNIRALLDMRPRTASSIWGAAMPSPSRWKVL